MTRQMICTFAMPLKAKITVLLGQPRKAIKKVMALIYVSSICYTSMSRNGKDMADLRASGRQLSFSKHTEYQSAHLLLQYGKSVQELVLT